jgi:transcriptional regulator with XRE-family HTH domain
MTTQATQVTPPSVFLAEEIRALFARHRASQTRLAAVSGRNQQYWSRRMNGDVPFDVNDLAALAGYLEVPIAELIAPLDAVAGGRQPIGRYGDTPGHDARNAWELAA